MHVLVTGASAGIGDAIAREYAKRGAKLTLSARREDRLRDLANDVGRGAAVVPADLSDPKAVPALCRAAEKAHGPVDVLINNAGVQIIEHAHKTDPDLGEALLDLDLASPLRLIREILPAMRKRGSGTIVNVASMAALSPLPGMLYYNAAKGGLANASEALRGELRGTGVNVLTVYPGPVHTDMGDTGMAKYEETGTSALAPWGTTEELAHLVCRAVELGRARVIYPRSYAVSLWFPNLSRWFSLRFSPPLKSEA
ncbi:MAG TPA: SDR family NAD(P)-dependent oxidoreductase [Polyangiaceae bacterium]|jgi:short-subunit dehydrogenase|nr:SDR family NAD(P)-dependent oxidoreductase [Polyangiaceae bacterium]